MEENLSEADTEGFAPSRAGSESSADTETEKLDNVTMKGEDRRCGRENYR